MCDINPGIGVPSPENIVVLSIINVENLYF